MITMRFFQRLVTRHGVNLPSRRPPASNAVRHGSTNSAQPPGIGTTIAKLVWETSSFVAGLGVAFVLGSIAFEKMNEKSAKLRRNEQFVPPPQPRPINLDWDLKILENEVVQEKLRRQRR